MKPHNPDNLTEAQIGEGCRLLTVSEIRDREETFAIHCWDSYGKSWLTDIPWIGSSTELTYRISLEQAETLNNS